jgi:putative drug exporter of the RND superfamily
MGRFVSRRPGWIVLIWLAVAVTVGALAPDLTKLAAEGEAKTLASDLESRIASAFRRRVYVKYLARSDP